jgi:hypothetical protein
MKLCSKNGAVFADRDIYEALEAFGVKYAVHPANENLE